MLADQLGEDLTAELEDLRVLDAEYGSEELVLDIAGDGKYRLTQFGSTRSNTFWNSASFAGSLANSFR